MTAIAMAGLAALHVATATRTDEPTARSAVAAEKSKSGDQRSRSDGPIAKPYEQIRAETIDIRDRCQRDHAGKAVLQSRSRYRQTPRTDETPRSSARRVAARVSRKMKYVAY